MYLMVNHNLAVKRSYLEQEKGVVFPLDGSLIGDDFLRTVLRTYYGIDPKIIGLIPWSKPQEGDEFRSSLLEVRTEFYTLPDHKLKVCIISTSGIQTEEQDRFSLNGGEIYTLDRDILSEHHNTCTELEQKIVQSGFVITKDTSWPGSRWLVNLSKEEDGEDRIYSLETKVRAPKYFLPDGFVIDGKQFYEGRIVSSAKSVSGGVLRKSSILSSDGENIRTSTEAIDHCAPLQAIHFRMLKWFVGNIYHNHYSELKHFDACEFLENHPHYLACVDQWDDRQIKLIQRAEKIAHTILEKSPLNGLIAEVVLYGSLSRQDKIPDDIDLLVFYMPEGDILDPTKYYDSKDKQCPPEYNVRAVTEGLVQELGIKEELDKYDSEHHIKINLNAISNRFFSDSSMRKRLLRMQFTPKYYRDLLVDGLRFNAQSRRFDILTKDIHKETISQLDTLLEQAEREKWPNLANERPKKEF